MKKWCALLLTIILFTTTSVSLADDDSFRIPTGMMELFDQSIDKWYATSLDRAIFTAIAAVEVTVSGRYESFDLMNSDSYVGLAEDYIFAIYSTGTTYVTVYLNTMLPDEFIVIPGSTNDPQYAAFMAAGLSDGLTFEKNDLSDIETALSLLLAILENYS